MEKNNLSWIILLIALFVAGYFVGINAYIQEVDPATYAEVSREMVESNDYIYLHDNYRDYLDKPPVTMWLIAACYKIFGITNYAVRIPPLVMAIIAILSVYLLGTMLWNKQAGLLSALIMASAAASRLMIQDPKIDMVLIGLMTLSIAFLFKGLTNSRFLWPGYIIMAFAFLTKGPISIGVPVLAFSSYAFFKKDISLIKKLKPIRGLSLTGIFIIPWYVAVAMRRGDYTAYFMLFKQSFGRFYAHQFYYGGDDLFYVHTFSWAFLPWTLLFITILIQRFINWRKKTRPDDGELFTLWWWILPFIILSLAISKLPQYIFWIIPPAALLTGRWLDKKLDNGMSKHENTIFSVQYIFVFLPLALILTLFIVSFPPETLLPWLVLGIGIILVILFSTLKIRKVKKLVILSALSMLTFDIMFAGYVYPTTLKYQPFQVFGKQIMAMAHGKKSTILSYKYGERGTLNYYSRMPVREVDTPQEVNQYLKIQNPSFFVTTNNQIKKLEAMGYEIKVINSLPFYSTSRPDKCFLLKWDRDKCLTNLSIGTISK
jgi:4-amino-4-deoxy-L-arabinose transferase-like glycosyltransferase